MNEFTLHFDGKTVEYIANVLAQRPYAEVAEVLRSLGEQMRQQQAQQQAQQQVGMMVNGGEVAQTAQ